MGRIANSQKNRYDPIESKGCIVCGYENTRRNVYHPRSLFQDQERGNVIKLCDPCYGSYQAWGLQNIKLDLVLEKLRSRRRNQCSDNYIKQRWNLGLMTSRDLDDNLVYAEDAETHIPYDIEDVKKYFDNRGWLIRESLETLRTWCQENLKDQRFIIKVVSSFNN